MTNPFDSPTEVASLNTDLFAEPQVIKRRTQARKKAPVAVPESVLSALRETHGTKHVVVWPTSAVNYESQRAVLLAAGPLLGGSVSIQSVTLDDAGKPRRSELATATHVQAKLGARRGKKAVTSSQPTNEASALRRREDTDQVA
jgi:hypothetical protein